MTIWCPDLSMASGPIYLAVADAIEADIRSGALAVGERLPPQRELAYQLGVTLGTVTRAYREAERRRLLRGETGRGTYVAPEEMDVSPLIPREDRSSDLDLARNFAYPHLNPDLSKGLARLARTPGIDRLNGFVPSEGLASHRETGASLFDLFHLTADPSNIALTCGAQHGIQVLLQALFRPGDGVAVDEFTYPSILNSAPHLGLKLVPIPLMQATSGEFLGMDPAALAEAARSQDVKGVFLMPNMHNPTTHTMTLAEREAIVAVAREFGLKIIEDDPYTPFVETKLPALGALAPELTASIASISKLISPGSRIGFVHVPREYGNSVRNLIGESTWMASPITAELISGWVRDGTLKRTLAEKRKANAIRYELASAVLGTSRLQGAADKVFAWLGLPVGVDPGVVEANLAHQGVAALSSRYFQVSDRGVKPYMRVTFGSIVGEIEFRRALELLDWARTSDPGERFRASPVG
ncbi:PLP-dependent aminotransferase family protein [Labrenzia polysiphoniae]|uniref:PLP-dependent aminotransferase family protein n=2 Tax=Roseibium polysiphoniae TaxID=2571221 RepID=A0ABR9CCX4_9HYPH|nr:PLP-dependent aminotransferase family protein [Roseibium polysiphoniae]